MVHSIVEGRLHSKGYHLVAGVDEAGRGPLAGPVFAAAVIFPEKTYIKGLDDSKKLSPVQRDRLFEIISDKAICIGVGSVNEVVIDKINILTAAYLAMKRAIEELTQKPQFILVDGNRIILHVNIPQRAIVGGDGICSSIAAASIIAKVARDRYMAGLHKKFPRYGFDVHKGYGTRAHFEAIRIHGPCNAHRKTFLTKLSARQHQRLQAD